MTCREKLAVEHPEYIAGYYYDGCKGCPSEYYYLNDPEWCKFSDLSRCSECWDREIPEAGCFADSVAQAGKIVKEAAKNIQRIAEESKEMPVEVEPVIKDSGDRTKFESGAVRDMREGKGRCDLMPLEVVADLFPFINEDLKSEPDPTLLDISTFKRTGDTKWLMGALFHFMKNAYDKSMSTMLLEAAKHYEEGAKKYGENNWQKGMPVWCYIDSAVRHYLKWLRGDTDESHDRAFVWNLMCCIWEVDYRDKKEDA